MPSKDDIKTQTALDISTLVSYSLAAIPNTVIGIVNERGAMVENQRNNIVDRSLAEGADYLFWVDSDMSFPRNALQILLSHGKDIIGATYNKRFPPHDTLGHFLGPNRDLSQGGLVEADFLPGGMMLVKADVYRGLGYPYYFTRTKWRGTTPLERFINMADDAAYIPMPDEVRTHLKNNQVLRDWLDAADDADIGKSMRVMSEDYAFCRRAVRAGYGLWCDLDLTYQIAHIGEQQVVTRPPGEREREALFYDPAKSPGQAALGMLNRWPARSTSA
jgi:hypothetical protein